MQTTLPSEACFYNNSANCHSHFFYTVFLRSQFSFIHHHMVGVCINCLALISEVEESNDTKPSPEYCQKINIKVYVNAMNEITKCIIQEATVYTSWARLVLCAKLGAMCKIGRYVQNWALCAKLGAVYKIGCCVQN